MTQTPELPDSPYGYRGPDFLPPEGGQSFGEAPTAGTPPPPPPADHLTEVPTVEVPPPPPPPPTPRTGFTRQTIVTIAATLLAVVIVFGVVIWNSARPAVTPTSDPIPENSPTTVPTSTPTSVPPPAQPPAPAPVPTVLAPAPLPAPPGTLLVAGWNEHGERGLGFSSTDFDQTQTAVPGLSDVKSVIDGGGWLVYAITNDGQLWAWGSSRWDLYGMFGDLETYYSYSPRKVPINGRVVSVTAKYGFTAYALTDNGSIWTWGSDKQQLPMQMGGLPFMQAISGGGSGLYGLARDGTVWMLGDSGYHSGETISPYQVSGLSSIVALAAGEASNLALDSQGVVWSWGDNTYGGVGDGTQSPRTTPIAVQGLPKISSVAVAEMSSLALGIDGSVWCWGSNLSGQCGTGEIPYTDPGAPIDPHVMAVQRTPVRVKDLPPVDHLTVLRQGVVAFSGQDIYVWGGSVVNEYVDCTVCVPGFSGIPSPVKLTGFDGITNLFEVISNVYVIAG